MKKIQINFSSKTYFFAIEKLMEETKPVIREK